MTEILTLSPTNDIRDLIFQLNHRLRRISQLLDKVGAPATSSSGEQPAIRIIETIRETVTADMGDNWANLQGRDGGQTLHGGTTSGESLNLVSNYADGATGVVSVASPMIASATLLVWGLTTLNAGLTVTSTIAGTHGSFTAGLNVSSTGTFTGALTAGAASLSSANITTTINVSGAASLAAGLNVMGSVGLSTATPHSLALLDLNSTTKGLLLPRMTAAQRNSMASAPAGLMIYNTTSNVAQLYTSTWTDL